MVMRRAGNTRTFRKTGTDTSMCLRPARCPCLTSHGVMCRPRVSRSTSGRRRSGVFSRRMLSRRVLSRCMCSPPVGWRGVFSRCIFSSPVRWPGVLSRCMSIWRVLSWRVLNRSIFSSPVRWPGVVSRPGVRRRSRRAGVLMPGVFSRRHFSRQVMGSARRRPAFILVVRRPTVRG